MIERPELLEVAVKATNISNNGKGGPGNTFEGFFKVGSQELINFQPLWGDGIPRNFTQVGKNPVYGSTRVKPAGKKSTSGESTGGAQIGPKRGKKSFSQAAEGNFPP